MSEENGGESVCDSLPFLVSKFVPFPYLAYKVCYYLIYFICIIYLILTAKSLYKPYFCIVKLKCFSMKEFLLHIYSRALWFVMMGLMIPAVASAQVSHGGMPCPVNLASKCRLRAASVVPFEEMPPFNRDSLLREDSLPGNQYGARRFANKFFVSVDMEHSGSTSILDDGTKVWRVGITSRGAYSLNLLFSEFDIPDQARLFVYSPDRSTILGSFTSQNRQKSGVFPVAPVDGDSIIVEYIEPEGVDFNGRLRISEVNHDYVGLRLLPRENAALPCEVDAKCDNLHSDQSRSACLIVVDGTYYCSGNLINNTSEDGTPYVLTASHCLFADYANPPIDASMAETSVFFFNYETPYCYSDIQGSLEQSVSGATVKACNTQRDMLLLELSEMPPVDYRTYYAGWNATDDISAPAYCFHHPAGDMKRISVENDLPYTSSFCTLVFKSKSHWKIYRWDSGVTEGGSSGSGLFDGNNRLIGALSGGASTCATTGDDDFYKLKTAWSPNFWEEENLEPWLDPKSTGSLLMDGVDPYVHPCVRLSNMTDDDSWLPDAASANGYAAGHNSNGYVTYAERFQIEGEALLYGVYFIPYLGRYSTESAIQLKIYSGDSCPTDLLFSQELRVKDVNYEKNNEAFQKKDKYYWQKKENYMRLESPVSVNKHFFVVFALPSTTKDTFALYYAGGRPADAANTAYFYEGSEWKSFTQNPLLNAPSSLCVDAVLQSINASSDEAIASEHPDAKVYVNQNGEVVLLTGHDYGEKQIRLYDLSGRLLSKRQVSGDRCVFQTDTEEGVFILQIVYADYTEVLKFCK